MFYFIFFIASLLPFLFNEVCYAAGSFFHLFFPEEKVVPVKILLQSPHQSAAVDQEFKKMLQHPITIRYFCNLVERGEAQRLVLTDLDPSFPLDPTLSPEKLYYAFPAEEFKKRYTALSQARDYARDFLSPWKRESPLTATRIVDFFKLLSECGLNPDFHLLFRPKNLSSLGKKSVEDSARLLADILQAVKLPYAPHLYDAFVLSFVSICCATETEVTDFKKRVLTLTEKTSRFSPLLKFLNLCAMLKDLSTLHQEKSLSLEDLRKRATPLETEADFFFITYPETRIHYALRYLSDLKCILGKYAESVRLSEEALAQAPFHHHAFSFEDKEQDEKALRMDLFTAYLFWAMEDNTNTDALSAAIGHYADDFDKNSWSLKQKTYISFLLCAFHDVLEEKAQQHHNEAQAQAHRMAKAKLIENILVENLEHLFPSENRRQDPPLLDQQTRSQSPTPTLPVLKIAPSLSPLPPAPLFPVAQHEEKWTPPPAPKEKIKTRKAPAFQPISTSLIPEQPSCEKEKISARTILKKEKFYKIFCKFFEASPKITRDETKKLLAAFGQEVDERKGKGSHAKASFSFRISPEKMEEVMIILAKRKNDDFLPPYQVIALRDVFHRFGLTPDEA